MAKILVLYYHRSSYPMRQVIEERIYAFGRAQGAETLFANAAFPLPPYLFRIPFDLLIFETTLLAQLRWGEKSYEEWAAPFRPLKKLSGVRALLPQDEFLRGADALRFIDEFSIEKIFSVAPQSEWELLYPSAARGRALLYPVLTGYLNERVIEQVATLGSPKRDIDISYRAWKAEPWLGSHGILKTEVARAFSQAAEGRGLAVDISTDQEKTFLGSDWARFLLRSKYTIGVEGGSSINDSDGSVRRKVSAYEKEHPNASFEEIAANCFPGRDGELKLFALSPRHLEACATRTCQLLVEGEYNGILQPHLHYLPIKRDFSNVGELIEEVQSDRKREEITERAWQEIAASGLYTYDHYVSLVVEKSLSPRNLQKERGTLPLFWRLQPLWEKLLWKWVALEAAVWSYAKRKLDKRFLTFIRSLKGR